MKKITRLLLGALTALLCLLMCTSLAAGCALYSVRGTLTNEFVYNTMANIDYSRLEFPDGDGGRQTITDMANESLYALGITLSDSDVSYFIEAFSLDVIVTSFMQDVRDWLIDDNARPTLNPSDMAEIIVGGMNSNLISLLDLGGNLTGFFTEICERLLSSVDIDGILDELEPTKERLSEGRMLMCASSAAVCCILILFTRRMKISHWLACSGISIFLSGVLCQAAVLYSNKKQTASGYQLTPYEFETFAKPLTEAVSQCAVVLILVGITAALIALAAAAVRKMLRG